MKWELLKNMIREEARLHTHLQSRHNFFAFPIALFIMTLFAAVMFAKFSDAQLNISGIAFYGTIIFFIMGMASGTFGLNASDFLERRFGDIGKLFGNALILPIKLSDIFLMSAASDAVFYLGWLVLPVWLGFAGALIFSGAGLVLVPKLFLLFIALFHAFIFGIMVSFFMTILFVRSKWIFTGLAAAIASGILFFQPSWNLFPSFMLYNHLSWASAGIALGSIILFIILSAMTVGREYHTSVTKKTKVQSFSPFFIKDPFSLKDYIDLRRTHGIIAKPLFSTLIPALLMLAALTSLNHLPTEFNLIARTPIFFAIIIGVLNVSFFNMLLQGDSMAYYQFLPVTLHQFIKGKVGIATIICAVEGTLLLIGYSLLNPTETSYLLQSIIMLYGIITYSITSSFFITGLHPNENALQATNFLKFALFMIPFMIIGMLLPFFIKGSVIYYIGISIALIAASLLLYRMGIRKWSKNLAV